MGFSKIGNPNLFNPPNGFIPHISTHTFSHIIVCSKYSYHFMLKIIYLQSYSSFIFPVPTLVCADLFIIMLHANVYPHNPVSFSLDRSGAGHLSR